MRKSLAIIFLVIFSCQVLPLKAIGKLLAKAQTTEEVQHDGGADNPDDCGLKGGKFADDFFMLSYDSDIAANTVYFESKISAIIHSADKLPPSWVGDTLSPPPDGMIS
jgi:hypothetical protein